MEGSDIKLAVLKQMATLVQTSHTDSVALYGQQVAEELRNQKLQRELQQITERMDRVVEAEATAGSEDVEQRRVKVAAKEDFKKSFLSLLSQVVKVLIRMALPTPHPCLPLLPLMFFCFFLCFYVFFKCFS